MFKINYKLIKDVLSLFDIHILHLRTFKMLLIKMVNSYYQYINITTGTPICTYAYFQKCLPCDSEYVRLFDVTEKTAYRHHSTSRSCTQCSKQLTDTIVHFGETVSTSTRAIPKQKQAFNISRSDIREHI